MTILNMLINKHADNSLVVDSLGIIKDNFINWVNDNYELTLSLKNELTVRIPSLEKGGEYVSESIGEYQYTLIMCMRIAEENDNKELDFMLVKFLELYKDKLEVFFKDVNTVSTLKKMIVKTKKNIDFATYYSMAIMILGVISLGIFTKTPNLVRILNILVIVISLIVMLGMQFTKEDQVKNIIDGYISTIRTDWYAKELRKQYTFLCNFME
jgi:hypothetical protein